MTGSQLQAGSRQTSVLMMQANQQCEQQQLPDQLPIRLLSPLNFLQVPVCEARCSCGQSATSQPAGSHTGLLSA